MRDLCRGSRRPTIYRHDSSAGETDNSTRLNLRVCLRRLRLDRHEGYLFRGEVGGARGYPSCTRAPAGIYARVSVDLHADTEAARRETLGSRWNLDGTDIGKSRNLWRLN